MSQAVTTLVTLSLVIPFVRLVGSLHSQPTVAASDHRCCCHLLPRPLFSATLHLLTMSSPARSPPSASIPTATAALPIRHLVTKQTVPFSSLYTTPSPQPAVTIFLRRWGCTLCRGYAKKLTDTLLPSLTHNGVRLVAIGFNTAGEEQWMNDQFFPSNQLYIDEGRKLYTSLGVKRPSALSGFMKLINSSTRAWNNEVKAMGITGNFDGDGLQLGATFVLSPTGQLWMERRQSDYGDHPTTEEIIAVLRSNMKDWKDLPAGGGSNGAAEETVRDESIRGGENGVRGAGASDVSIMASPLSSVKVLEKIGTGANRCSEDCF